MKKSILATAVAISISSGAAFATCGGNGGPSCTPTLGDVSSSIIINGGGQAWVSQAGAGSSSAQFTTTSDGSFDGSTSLNVNPVGPSGGRGFSVDTGAAVNGDARSTTTGTVTGNAGGYNYSNSSVEGQANVDGSYTRDGNVATRDLNVGSSALGGASAVSSVSFGPNTPGVTTSGSSYQQADFSAYNNSSASGHVSRGDEYCENPMSAELSVTTTGGTRTSVNGNLSGDGASGGSDAYAAQGGYANGDVSISNEYGSINLDASVDNDFTFNGTPVQSYSVSTNGGGNGVRNAGSASDAYVNVSGDVYGGPCCTPSSDSDAEDGKFVSGYVSGGNPEYNHAGGGVSVEFGTTVTTGPSAP